MAAALVASASWTVPARAQAPARGGATPPAGAQAPTSPPGAKPLGTSPAAPAKVGTDARAAARFEVGVQAAKSGRWSDACAAFAEAWQLKPTAQVAANLGRAALMTGKPREAVERLTYFKREARGEVSRGDRALVDELLGNARKQIGTLTLSVNRAGAKLLVDGAPVEQASASKEILVDPGRRVMEARLPEQPPAPVEVEVPAGSKQHVGLWLVEAQKPPGEPTARVAKEEGSGKPRALLVGAGIATLAGVGAGVVLTIASENKAATHDTQPENYDRLEKEQVALANASFWSFVGAGAVGAVTLGHMLLAPNSKGDVTVRVEARGTGMSVQGAW